MMITELKDQITDVQLEQLSDLMIAVVEEGASVGFMPPISREEANAYWLGVLQPGVRLWVMESDDRIRGTVQLHLAMKANGSHRAEIAKLLVHPESRRLGIARALMRQAEEQARALGRTLLVLDTRQGDPSNSLYGSLGYIEAGRIPEYARSADGQLHTTVIYYKKW